MAFIRSAEPGHVAEATSVAGPLLVGSALNTIVPGRAQRAICLSGLGLVVSGRTILATPCTRSVAERASCAFDAHSGAWRTPAPDGAWAARRRVRRIPIRVQRASRAEGHAGGADGTVASRFAIVAFGLALSVLVAASWAQCALAGCTAASHGANAAVDRLVRAEGASGSSGAWLAGFFLRDAWQWRGWRKLRVRWWCRRRRH